MCVCVCVCVYHSLYVLTVSCTHYLSPEIGNCRQIVFLELQHNDLQALPDTIGNLIGLKRVGLRSVVGALCHYHLCVCACACTLAIMVTVCVCCVCRYNKVTEIPATMCECLHLQELNMESNNLVSLPVSLFPVTQWLLMSDIFFY